MALFPVVNGKVSAVYDVDNPNIEFKDGLRYEGQFLCATLVEDAVMASQGVWLDRLNRVCMVDITDMVDPAIVYNNGLPTLDKKLCVTLTGVTHYQNGIPFSDNSGVCI